MNNSLVVYREQIVSYWGSYRSIEQIWTALWMSLLPFLTTLTHSFILLTTDVHPWESWSLYYGVKQVAQVAFWCWYLWKQLAKNKEEWGVLERSDWNFKISIVCTSISPIEVIKGKTVWRSFLEQQHEEHFQHFWNVLESAVLLSSYDFLFVKTRKEWNDNLCPSLGLTVFTITSSQKLLL